MSAIAAALGRVLIALIFLVSGINKLLHITQTEAAITGVGLPSGLAIPTGVFEVVASLALAFGFVSRLSSLLLAGFVALTILFFHNQFTDPVQATMAMKNLAIIGGLLLVFAYGNMRWSYDYLRAERAGEVSARSQETRAQEAELRAARAEAKLEAISRDR